MGSICIYSVPLFPRKVIWNSKARLAYEITGVDWPDAGSSDSCASLLLMPDSLYSYLPGRVASRYGLSPKPFDSDDLPDHTVERPGLRGRRVVETFSLPALTSTSPGTQRRFGFRVEWLLSEVELEPHPYEAVLGHDFLSRHACKVWLDPPSIRFKDDRADSARPCGLLSFRDRLSQPPAAF